MAAVAPPQGNFGNPLAGNTHGGGRGGGRGGAGTGYEDLIRGDPFYLQQQALLGAQGAADAARLAQRLSEILIQFGQVPEGFTFENLPGTTGALAQQNTDAGLSLLSRINKAAADAQRQTMGDLASRGILQSGETGYQLGELALQRKQAEYDARTSVLSQINQLQDAFASADLQRQLALIDAAMQAYGRQASLPQNLPPIEIPGVPSSQQPNPTTPAPTYATPSAQEIALMARWVPYARGQRPQEIIDLFQKYLDWRTANPNWWQG